MYKIIPAAYIFTHQYLNTMQQGIQSLHVVGEFFAKYPMRDSASIETSEMYYKTLNWVTEHKVVRILNGGVDDTFNPAKRTAEQLAKKYALPFAEFAEPDISSMTTGFGIIVTPDIVFDIDNERETLLLHGVHHDIDRDMSVDIDSHPLVQFLMKFNSAK